LFAHDWRVTPAIEWLDRNTELAISGPNSVVDDPVLELTVLSRPEFETAAHDALSHFHSTERLSGNPLIRSQVVMDRPEADPITGLRNVMREAIETIRQESEMADTYAILVTTYLDASTSQEDLARNLHMSLSTYRRRLRRGRSLVGDVLWRLETTGIILPSNAEQNARP
jgi:hypothetical protein